MLVEEMNRYLCTLPLQGTIVAKGSHLDVAGDRSTEDHSKGYDSILPSGGLELLNRK